MKAYKKYEIISRKHEVKLIRQKESRESKKIEESVEVNPMPLCPARHPRKCPACQYPPSPAVLTLCLARYVGRWNAGS